MLDSLPQVRALLMLSHRRIPVSVKLGVQLGRQPSADGMTVTQVATAAVELVRLGKLARMALERGRPPDVHIEAAAAIAQQFGASVVDRRDLAGLVMGLRFRGRTYSSPGNVFFVA